MTDLPNAAVSANPLSKQIYELLKERIIAGTIQPSARLVIHTIAAEFDVSSTPVRDALQMLVNEGFAVRKRGGAVCAIHLTRTDVIELYQLREVLEGLAVRLSIERIPQAELEDLLGLFLKQKEQLLQDHSVSHAVDVSFHDTVGMACPNRRLRRQMQLILNQSYRIRRMQHESKAAELAAQGTSSRLLQEIEDHSGIIKTMLDNKPDAAEAAMRRHIAQAKADILTHVDIPEWTAANTL